MISNDAHDSQPTPRRFTLKSGRGALAVSAVALSVLGLSQVSGTSAAWQETAAATSGALTVSSNVLPNVATVKCSRSGSWGFYNADMEWAHLGTPFVYSVQIYRDTGELRWTHMVVPAETTAAGTKQTLSIDDSELGTHTGWNYTLRVYTVNRYTEEVSTGWVGHKIWQQATRDFYCDGNDSDTQAAASQPLRMAPAPTDEVAAPTKEVSTVVPSTMSSAPSSTSSTPLSPTTIASPAPGTTSATHPATTTPRSTAPATVTPTSATSTTTPSPDTLLGAAQVSPVLAYSSQLMTSPGTGQTSIAITDANGEELKRLSVTSAAQYKWDPSTDTLWIVDEGQLYKASGSDWTKTVVDPSSDDVPADIAALLE